MIGSLHNRHAVITGGGRGIGAAIASSLSKAGAKVTLMGRSQEAMGKHAGTLEGEHHIEVVNVADAASVTRAFLGAITTLGPITVLVNNAGQAESQPFLKTDLEVWNQMLQVNLTGTFLCTQAALPEMLKIGWGRIVNIASTAGLKGYPYVSAYVAAKHGVIGLTKALALELAKKNITVNAVCPGYTETDMVENAVANIVQKTGRSEAEAKAELAKSNPQGRLIQPEEVAEAVLWLCSPNQASITGQAIVVAGGEVMA